jgi:hypothetical protein
MHPTIVLSYTPTFHLPRKLCHKAGWGVFHHNIRCTAIQVLTEGLSSNILIVIFAPETARYSNGLVKVRSHIVQCV